MAPHSGDLFRMLQANHVEFPFYALGAEVF
jgi:hypothetical protein